MCIRDRIFTGVYGNTDEPRLFVLIAFKRSGTEGIFQKHGLKYVLGISIIFQMNQAKPPNHIGILFDCPVSVSYTHLDVYKRQVFDHVGFAYDKKDVLQDVSFTAKEGEITALVGPSGSGKSTCARLAARLWDVTRGSIQVGGVDISTVDPEVLLLSLIHI